ncbi:hypothetical protein ADL21_11215 [Streptomyces albus subsp. albus]|nr:hypothetical protein ADL21_11215 [Streptomyces albus subsp. albus]
MTTDARGRKALTGVGGVSVLPLDTPASAEVFWRRHGTTSEQVGQVLNACPGLRWLHTDTAGVDDLPLAALAAREVTVTRTTAYAQAVAEWIVTAVLLAAKGVPAYVRAGDRREWAPGAGRPRLVAGTRALIIGNGAIGSRARAMLHSMDVHVRTSSRRAPGGWRRWLPATDWLVLACPLTAETRGLIDATALASLKPGAWVINVARGGILDEQALATALGSGALGGAVLDTFATEPLPRSSRLWGREQVLVLPHDTWRARGAGLRQVECFLRLLERYRAGQPLSPVVDPTAGY